MCDQSEKIRTICAICRRHYNNILVGCKFGPIVPIVASIPELQSPTVNPEHDGPPIRRRRSRRGEHIEIKTILTFLRGGSAFNRQKSEIVKGIAGFSPGLLNTCFVNCRATSLPANCCTQAGLNVVVFNVVHDWGSSGGKNRSGGAAKGIPRNLLTVAVAEGKLVVVPTITPDGNVTVGACAEHARTRTNKKAHLLDGSIFAA